MIGRWLASAVVLALPLVAGAQTARAPRASSVPQVRTEDEAPLVRVWIPGAATFHYGELVSVSFEVSDDAHVAVVRVDGNGRLTVLWPTNRNLQTAARAGREYRVSGPDRTFAAFAADYEVGSGMVIAIASYDPIDLTAFRRYRNDETFYRYASLQQPYYGGVRRVVDRITQEILYAPDSPYDYDVAFYSVMGRGRYANASYGYCNNDDYGSSRARRYSYWSTALGWPLAAWDDCYSSFYHAYFAYCASWTALNGYAWCRQWNPNWPVPPAPPAPQPQTPTVNISMIDSVMARPVDKYPIINRSPEQPTTNGTTHVVTMEPARESPNVTRWLPDDDNAAISIPRLRRSGQDAGSGGGRINTRDEGFRSPGTGIRTDEPRVTDRPIDRSAFMPPVRQPPREPAVWRDNDRIDRSGSNHPSSQRWERPGSTDHNPAGRIDRGSTTGGSSPTSAPSPTPTVTPRTDATVTKTSETKSSDPPKTSGERKPQ